MHGEGVMIAGRWAASLLVLTVSAPAWADGDELDLPVPVKVSAREVSAEPAAEPVAEPAARPKQKGEKAKSGYHAVLGSLAIAKDLQIPGAVMSVRLLPTSRALSGETSTPIVLRPRVPGGGGWYGVDIAARF